MDKRTEILIVDDEADIREVLRLLLAAEGYAVREAASGEEALASCCDSVDMIILDVMMPGEDGYAVCRRLRERTSAPVLFLTAKTTESDRVDGLRAGGDDYLAKPFSAGELTARVAALLRRYHVYGGAPARTRQDLIRGEIRVRFDTGEVFHGNARVTLTDLETRVLCYLAERAGTVVDARTLYEAVWREPYLLSSASTIMVHIRNLRKKLEREPSQPALIRTVWGKGYELV